MHPRAKRPVLVPAEHFSEIADLSKSALMDIAWSLAGQTVESAEDTPLVIAKIREEWGIIKKHRSK
jgi:hypothetical protein